MEAHNENDRDKHRTQFVHLSSTRFTKLYLHCVFVFRQLTIKVVVVVANVVVTSEISCCLVILVRLHYSRLFLMVYVLHLFN